MGGNLMITNFKKYSVFFIIAVLIFAVSFSLADVKAEDTVEPISDTESVQIEGTVIPVNVANRSNVVPIPGGYIIKDISIMCKGKEFDTHLPGGIIRRVKSITKQKYGKIELDRHYRVIYDNRVRQVHIYSYKGVIENIRVIRM